MTLSEEGYVKKEHIYQNTDYKQEQEKGITNLKVNDKTGKVVDVKIVDNESEIMLITSEGT